MGWVRGPHACVMPFTTTIDVFGMVWECEKCYKGWKCLATEGPNDYGHYYNTFVLTEDTRIVRS